MKYIIVSITTLVLIGLLLFAGSFYIREYSLKREAYFQPKEEALRRSVYEQSKAYREGTIRDLQNLMIDYKKADKQEVKTLLANTFLHRVADIQDYDLPSELLTFKKELSK